MNALKTKAAQLVIDAKIVNFVTRIPNEQGGTFDFLYGFEFPDGTFMIEQYSQANAFFKKLDGFRPSRGYVVQVTEVEETIQFPVSRLLIEIAHSELDGWDLTSLRSYIYDRVMEAI